MNSVIGRVVAAVVAVLAVVAAVSSCRASAPVESTQAPSVTPTASGSPHNAADVAFLQNMIPHHQQALELSAMVPAHSADARLVGLSQQIAGQQRAEIDGFRAQLLQWEAPRGPRPKQMEGMVDQATMDKLATLHGADFDKLWLQSMIGHHRGAIAMAQTEIADGQSPDIISIAKSIRASQQAEVDQMNQMLGG